MPTDIYSDNKIQQKNIINKTSSLTDDITASFNSDTVILTEAIYTVSQKNCANLSFAPCLSNMNRFQ